MILTYKPHSALQCHFLLINVNYVFRACTGKGGVLPRQKVKLRVTLTTHPPQMKSLPYGAMEHIFSFLDPSALARIAQVSRGWRDIVYRNDVWLGFEYSIRTCASDLFYNTVPQDAHHIGEPTHYCFLNWILHKPSLPTKIACISDQKAYVQKVWDYWVSLKKPCRKINHHCASDVMIGGGYLKTMEKRDRQRVALRSLAPLCTDTKTAYIAWLEAQRASIPGFPSLQSPSIESSSLDPLAQLKYQTALLLSEQSKAIADIRVRACTNLDISLHALARQGKSVFEANARRMKADPALMWDNVSFTWEPDPPQTAHV